MSADSQRQQALAELQGRLGETQEQAAWYTHKHQAAVKRVDQLKVGPPCPRPPSRLFCPPSSAPLQFPPLLGPLLSSPLFTVPSAGTPTSIRLLSSGWSTAPGGSPWPRPPQPPSSAPALLFPVLSPPPPPSLHPPLPSPLPSLLSPPSASPPSFPPPLCTLPLSRNTHNHQAAVKRVDQLKVQTPFPPSVPTSALNLPSLWYCAHNCQTSGPAQGGPLRLPIPTTPPPFSSCFAFFLSATASAPQSVCTQHLQLVHLTLLSLHSTPDSCGTSASSVSASSLPQSLHSSASSSLFGLCTPPSVIQHKAVKVRAAAHHLQSLMGFT